VGISPDLRHIAMPVFSLLAMSSMSQTDDSALRAFHPGTEPHRAVFGSEHTGWIPAGQPCEFEQFRARTPADRVRVTAKSSAGAPGIGLA
jgi:hypothetical protein